MTQQTLIDFTDTESATHLRCPGCGYCPAEANIPLTPTNFACGAEVDYFGVIGADVGNVFCTKCGREFSLGGDE